MVASRLGKAGTATDLALYDKKESNTIRTWVAPTGFPEKIQPLFQAVNMAEYAILYLDGLDRFAGEQIVALDILERREGILSHTYDVGESRLDAIVRGTVLEGYRRVMPEKLTEAAAEFEPVPGRGGTRVVVDHSFEVRGAGTVVLAKIFSGSVRRYDNLKLLPLNREVTVRSIQMHDNDVNEASSPARVGLSLKNVRHNEIRRGDVLCDFDLPVLTEIELDSFKRSFYKGDMAVGQTCLLSIGLQVLSARLASTDPVRLDLGRPAVCMVGETCVMLRPESPDIRIMGHGHAT